MVQKYIGGMSNRSAVITWFIVTAIVKALIRKYPNVVGTSILTLRIGRRVYFVEWNFRVAGKLPPKLIYQNFLEMRLSTFSRMKSFRK